MAALLLGPAEEAIEDVKDASAVFEDFIEDVTLRLSVPRRIKDRMRTIVTSQRRLASGRLGALPRRDFFADAATLFALDCEAVGDPVPEWADSPTAAEHAGGRRRRRRRRRNRR